MTGNGRRGRGDGVGERKENDITTIVKYRFVTGH